MVVSSLERAVVSGAGGFVGQALAARLEAPFTALRFAPDDWRARLDAAPLEGATVFHLAARVHAPGTRDPQDYVRDNVDKTRALAQRAAECGARRLVFLSSIKVHGEESGARPFRETDAPAPEDDYGRSKWAAEQALTEVAKRARLPFAIVRSPLVYGPRVAGNLATLLRIADSPFPLPFASLGARRSFVHRNDLADLLIACATHPAAAGRTFLAAHADSVTAARLLALLRASFGRPARLFPVPAAALELGAALTGLRASMRRLTRALEADPSAALRELQWSARVPIELAVEEMVRAYREVRQ